jgi:hypothetical protein
MSTETVMTKKPPEPYIELDQATHTYYVDGVEQIGLTKVLKLAGLIDDDWYTEYGRWRGSAVHLATRFFDEGDIDRRTLDPVIKPFVADWKDFRDRTGFVPVVIEKPYYDGLYNFCCTPDRLGYFSTWQQRSDEPNVIADLKAYPSGQVPAWVRYQLAGQGRAINPNRVFHRFAVVLTGKGPTVESYPTEDYIEDVNDFLACIRIARLKEKL